MTTVANFEVVITDTDRKMARDAMVEGWHACKVTNYFGCDRPCDCDLGMIGGCKSKVESVALAIALARKM